MLNFGGNFPPGNFVWSVLRLKIFGIFFYDFAKVFGKFCPDFSEDFEINI